METLDLPPPLAGILDGLAREVSRASIAAAIRRQLQQAQSPLSLVRQDAYASLAASLDLYLRDPLRAAAVLPALGAVWPELLQSIALGLRQAPAGAGRGVGASPAPSHSPGSAGGGAASYRSVSHGELTCMMRVLELACLLALQARRSSLDAGLLPLLLGQLPAAPPELACAAMDALLAVQLRHPAAFVSFAEQGGVGQVCQLLRERGTPEPVRSHAVQFLNLLLSQLVPDLLPPDARPPTSPAPGSTPRPGPPTPGPAGPAPCEGQPEAAAAVLAALDGAKAAVTETLGREVWSMLQRRISLSDVSAEAKLGQLSSALTLFIESDA